jgi:hypothetical protein
MNKKPLTRLQALKDTKSLWSWMTKHPNACLRDTYKLKEFWPGWKKVGYTNVSYCPCCEFRNQGSTRSDCSICPLKGYAWDIRCLDGDTLYRKWRNARTDREQSAAAHKMVLACPRAIYKETK